MVSSAHSGFLWSWVPYFSKEVCSWHGEHLLVLGGGYVGFVASRFVTFLCFRRQTGTLPLWVRCGAWLFPLSCSEKTQSEERAHWL